MSGRTLPEWIGKTPDAPVPPRVRLRVFERHDGRCWISGRKIMPGDPWDMDHLIALCNGGEHRESNLAPALRDKHRVKTTDDVAEKSAVAKKRKKHLGIRPRSKFQTSRDGRFKAKIGGGVVVRETGEPA